MPSGTWPLILPFAGVMPVLAAPPEAGPNSSVLGRATAGAGLVLGPFAVIRADGDAVRLGTGVCLGEGATVHIARDRYPTVIGDRVTVGSHAVVHACTVGDDCVIEDDVVILDGSRVGEGVLIEAGSTIYPRSVLESGGRYAGSPAARVGTVPHDLRAARAGAIRAAAAAAIARGAGFVEPGHTRCRPAGFVAETALLRGDVAMADGASVFFGCRLHAASLVVGRDTNIQDNTVVEAGSGAFTVGAGSTIGHNVRAEACLIGAGSLVGIGAFLAEGTVVADDVLVAAGTATVPGQVLESGWLWAGRPARAFRRLDTEKRAMMAATVAHYRAYGRSYREAQLRRGAS